MCWPMGFSPLATTHPCSDSRVRAGLLLRLRKDELGCAVGSLPSWTISDSLISASRSPHRYFRRSSIPQARRRLHRCPRCWRSRRTANSSSYPIEHTPRSGCICSSAPTTDAHAIPAALPSPARAVVLAGANAALSELVNLISLIAARRGVRVRDEARAPLVSSSSPSELTPPSQRVCRFTLATNRCPNSRAPVSPGEGELADGTGRAALADRPKCNWRIVLLLHDWRSFPVRRMPTYDPGRGSTGRASRERRGSRNACAPRCRARQVPAGRPVPSR